ncbi:hypothetical protein M569_13267 [Genlisea aurea]|uniref:Uncharacterized protein n=1 Tax=Genlisea aurea TaxID=192259 RepID=S8C4E8_9LAMI|nr:hypothetical protein M569_13267 [Genlisea aurea]
MDRKGITGDWEPKLLTPADNVSIPLLCIEWLNVLVCMGVETLVKESVGYGSDPKVEGIEDTPIIESVKDDPEAETEESINQLEEYVVHPLNATETDINDKISNDAEASKIVEESNNAETFVEEKVKKIEPETEGTIIASPEVEGSADTEHEIEETITAKNIEDAPVVVAETTVEETVNDEQPPVDLKSVEAAIHIAESETKISEPPTEDEVRDIEVVLTEPERKVGTDISLANDLENTDFDEDASLSRETEEVKLADTSERTSGKPEFACSESVLEKKKLDALENIPDVQAKLVNGVYEDKAEALSTGMTEEIAAKDARIEDIAASEKIITETQVPDVKTEKESSEPVVAEKQVTEDLVKKLKEKADQSLETKLVEERRIADTPVKTLQEEKGAVPISKPARNLRETKTLQDAFHKDDIPAVKKKPSIAKIVKHSFAKAKKAILGKSHNSEATQV